MTLVNWEINLILYWSGNYIFTNSKGAEILTITDKKKLWAPAVVLYLAKGRRDDVFPFVAKSGR